MPISILTLWAAAAWIQLQSQPKKNSYFDIINAVNNNQESNELIDSNEDDRQYNNNSSIDASLSPSNSLFSSSSITNSSSSPSSPRPSLIRLYEGDVHSFLDSSSISPQLLSSHQLFVNDCTRFRGKAKHLILNLELIDSQQQTTSTIANIVVKLDCRKSFSNSPFRRKYDRGIITLLSIDDENCSSPTPSADSHSSSSSSSPPPLSPSYYVCLSDASVRGGNAAKGYIGIRVDRSDSAKHPLLCICSEAMYHCSVYSTTNLTSSQSVKLTVNTDFDHGNNNQQFLRELTIDQQSTIPITNTQQSLPSSSRKRKSKFVSETNGIAVEQQSQTVVKRSKHQSLQSLTSAHDYNSSLQQTNSALQSQSNSAVDCDSIVQHESIVQSPFSSYSIHDQLCAEQSEQQQQYQYNDITTDHSVVNSDQQLLFPSFADSQLQNCIVPSTPSHHQYSFDSFPIQTSTYCNFSTDCATIDCQFQLDENIYQQY